MAANTELSVSCAWQSRNTRSDTIAAVLPLMSTGAGCDRSRRRICSPATIFPGRPSVQDFYHHTHTHRPSPKPTNVIPTAQTRPTPTLYARQGGTCSRPRAVRPGSAMPSGTVCRAERGAAPPPLSRDDIRAAAAHGEQPSTGPFPERPNCSGLNVTRNGRRTVARGVCDGVGRSRNSARTPARGDGSCVASLARKSSSWCQAP